MLDYYYQLVNTSAGGLLHVVPYGIICLAVNVLALT